MRFKDRVAIVTGAASGIGLATAKLLGIEGARIVVADINTQDAAKAGEAIKKAGAPDAVKIAAALPTVSVNGLSGTVAFLPDGERKDAEVAILEAKGGKFTLVESVK